MIRFRKTIGCLVGLALAAYTTCAFGQVKTAEITLAPCDYYVFAVPAGEPPLFVPIQPVELKIQRWALADGSYMCTFATGPAGRQIVVDAYRNGKPGEMPIFVRLIAKVEGDAPTPPPGPNPPPLKGLAKQIYESAAKVDRPDDAAKMAAAFGGVASAIAAGGITTLEDARAAVTKAMQAISPLDAAWEPTGDMCVRAMNQFAQTIKDARVTLQAIADGLARAAL